MKNRRLLLLSACAAALAAYAVWSGSAGGLLTLAGGGDAAAVAEAPAQAPEGHKPGEAVPLNPLAGIAIDSFAAIVDRPLFNPTRTPPPPPVENIAPVEVAGPAPAAPQNSAKPEDFTLLAIAIADDARIAMLRWNKTNEVFHLKPGQYLSDWELRSVGEKEVTIGRDDVTFSLKLFERARRPSPPPVQGDAEEMMNEPGGRAVEPEDTGAPDPELNSN